MHFEFTPSKIKVCHCEQCRLSKATRPNRKHKKRIRRYLKRSARQQEGKMIFYYWA